VYESTPKLRRADLHERLGELLEASGAAEELVAFHLERATRLRSELRPQERESVAERAAEHLERAGERALARRDGDAARAFLTRAAELLDDGSAMRRRIETSLVATDAAAARAELVPGDVIGGYRVRAVAGRGGMGVVYRAEDLALGRQVALKVIAPDLAGDTRFRGRFVRESRIAAGLEHVNVVPVYGAGEESGRLFIAMRFIEGTDLQQLLRTGALDAPRAVAIVSQVAEALDAAHRRGLVHRDVKPANVLVAMVGATEQAYLTDFGLTRDAAAGDGLTKTGQWVGTLAYVSPEQIRGEPVDARADIYALGAVLYQCVTGHPPFSVDSELEALAAHLDEPPPRPSKDGAPRGLDAVVERAMSKDPGRRFRSAGDLGRAAVAAVEGGRLRLSEQSVATGAAAPVDVGRRRRRQGRRGATLVGLGVGAVLAGLAAAVAFALGVFSSGGAAPANAAGGLDGEPIHLSQAPDRLAVSGGYLWAMTTAGGQLARIEVEAGRVEYEPAPFDLGGGTFPDLAGGTGSLWQTHANPTVGGVDRIDPATMEGIERIALPSANALAVGTDGVWVTTAQAEGSGQQDALARIDPGPDRLVGALVPLGPDLADVAVAPSAVWVVDRASDSVFRVDPSTMRVRARIAVGDAPAVVAVSPVAVWVANIGDRTLTRIDPVRDEAVGAPITLGKELEDILAASGALWVATADGTVTRLDVATGKLVGAPIAVGRAPLTLAWDQDRVWVGSTSDRTVQAIRP
jgi:serine/threonine-protein kinase